MKIKYIHTLTLRESLLTAQTLPLDRLDAQLLLLHVLAHSVEGATTGEAQGRAWLLAHDDEALPPEAQQQFEALTVRRAAGEPLAYLTGFKSFYGLDVAVTPAVLIPRPDTETLVDWALAVLPPNQPAPRVLDLGTGSGAIALALKQALRHSHPQAVVWATDYSQAALQIATANALRLGLDITFLHSNWLLDLPKVRVESEGRELSPVTNPSGQPTVFDVIVSNPPYIVEGDAHLPALRHEPISALAAGSDGLADIRQIVSQAPAHLHAGGWLLLEHGFEQASAVREMLTQAGFASVQSRRDLNGIERCSGGRFLG